jgi:hypothetical protein
MYVIERWTGKAWAPSMCSPYKSIAEVRKHLEDYAWHYTEEHPYRLEEYKPKKINKYQNITKRMTSWNSDDGMVVVNRVMK